MRLAVRRSRVDGLGVFTEDPVPAGATLLSFSHVTLPWREVLVRFGQDYLDRCLQVDDGVEALVEPGSPGWYLNHSCEPNAGVSGPNVVAMRDLEPGEEVLLDYSLTLGNDEWTMECSCGAPSCRLTVGSFWRLPEETRRRYLPFAAQHIRRRGRARP